MTKSAPPKKTLLHQLLVTITSLIALILVTVAGVIAFYHNKHLNDDLQHDIEQLKANLIDKGHILTRQVRTPINENLSQLNLTALQKQLNTLVADNDELDFAILMSRKRTAYAHTQRPEFQTRLLNDNKARQMASFTAQQSLEYATHQTPYIEVVTPITLQRQHWGVLRLGFSLADIESMRIEKKARIKNELYWTLTITSLATTLFMLLGALIAYRIAEKVASPIEKLTRQAGEVIAGNYQSLAETAESISNNTVSEIAELGASLQHISNNLIQSQQAIKGYSQKLENKVAARTNELELARQQIEMNNTLKSEFLANISHEIRTPLSAVMGLTHLLNQTTLTPRQQDYTHKLASSGANLLTIINDILDFAKIEAGTLHLEKISFNFNEVLDKVIQSIARPAQDKGLEFIIDIKSPLPEILIGDAARLQQIFLNLLSNAVKYTECGEVTLTINVLESNDQSLWLSCQVSDTGIGMSAEQSSRVFNSFTSTATTVSHRHGGTGLRLNITKKLVEMMGGEISATSTYGIGTEFVFTAAFAVPLQPKQPDVLTKAPLPVLLIDNNNHSNNAVAQMLKRSGCAVTQVHSSQQGLDDAVHASQTGQPYRLIICKADMPQLRGEELALRISNNTELSSTPKIVLISRFADVAEYSPLIGSRLDALLTSPVIDSHLKPLIRHLFTATDQASPITPLAKPRTFEGCHILLAEDDEINQQIAAELLRSKGIEVTVANNGQEVLDLMLGKSPLSIDGILMDLQMPEMNGYDATSALRSDSRYTKLPIIGLTAHTSDDEKQRCLDKGMRAHLSKPIEPEQLFNAIDRYIVSTPTSNNTNTVVSQTLKNPDNISFTGVNLQEGLKRVNDNHPIYIRIAKQFIAKNADAADSIRQQLLIKQFDSASTLALSLRGASASIGANDLAYNAAKLEKSLRKRQPDTIITRHLETFEKAHKTTLKSLSDIIQHLEHKACKSKSKTPVIRPMLSENERIRILLVDDNASNLDVLSQQLAIIGYKSDACQNGAEAWQKWQTNNYHLILTDINMPGIDGYELTRRVRDIEAGSSHTPIIAFTAASSKGDAHRCLNIGMDEFLLKPMALQDLKKTLEKWLPKERSSITIENAQQTPTIQQSLVSTDNHSAIDIVVLIQVVGDDINVHHRLFDSFIKSAKTAISAINAAVESNVNEVVIKQAHKLKSASLNLGALKLADLCEAIEGAAGAGQREKLVSLMPSLNRLFDDVQAFAIQYTNATLPA